MNLSEAKLEQLNAATTFRVYGQVFEGDESASRRKSERASDRWVPIGPCFCVHDSPDSPCPCMPDSFWWLHADSIVRRGSAERSGPDGKKLEYFDVLADSTILVESVQAIPVSVLKALGSDLSPGQIRDVTSASAAVLTTLAKPSGGGSRLGKLVELILETLAAMSIEEILAPIDVEGAIEEWKKGKGKPPA